MKFHRAMVVRVIILLLFTASLTILSTRLHADTGNCGGVIVTLPFNDVMASPFFCQIAAAYFSGLTNGTTATTYSPTQTVTCEQMAAFTTRTLDQSLKRGIPPAIAGRFFSKPVKWARSYSFVRQCRVDELLKSAELVKRATDFCSIAKG